MFNAKAFSTIVAAVSAVGILIGCNPPQPVAPTREAPSNAAPVLPSSSVPGPIPGSRMTEEYVRHVGAMAYLWGWPMVNIHNRKTTFEKLPGPGMMGGIVPVAPSNQIGMLRDYIVPEERVVACPNQDVVYGFSLLDLTQEPVVIQVPNFGDRFWVYQVVDQRTDSFAKLGKMYGTKPGFTCWWDLTGRDSSRAESLGSISRRQISGSLFLARSWMILPRTDKLSSRFLRESCCIR